MNRSRRLSGGIATAIVFAGSLVPGAGALRAQTPSAPPPTVSPGETVPSFDAEGLDGVVRHVDYPRGSSTLVLFFLSGCPTCHRMIPLWNQAYQKRPPGLNVVGVLMDKEPPGFFMATPISFPVVRSPGKDLLRAYKISRVPLTLRVGPGGKVEDVALGLVDGIRLGELFRR